MSERAEGRGFWPAVACGAAGLALFQLWGNATHGYIATNSLFYWWGFQWVNPESETQHAWLVLALSLYLFWRNLGRTAASGPENLAAGIALIGALLLHGVGYVAQQPRVSIVALLLFLWGLLALGGGRRLGSASAFPLAFMVFAVPVNVLDTVGFWLRMWVVEAGAGIAHVLGIAVVRTGTQLIAPDGTYRYDVVAACSGVRSLMALSAMALVIGYLWLRPAWLRCAVLLLCLPLVYVGNVARIASIILAAQWGGQEWGNRVHDVMGFGVFVIVLGGVMAAAEILSRVRPDWSDSGARAPSPPGGVPRPGPGRAALAAAVVLLAAAEGAYLSHRAAHPPVAAAGVRLAADGENPAELPAFLGSEWMGQRVEPTAVERSILPPDTGFSRKRYFSREGPAEQVLLSIVLSGRDRTSIHRPELCLVGQGYTIEGSELHRFAYPGHPQAAFEATILRIRQDVRSSRGTVSEPELVAYWFVGADRVIASQGARMAYDAWNRVVHGRADRWAYVLLQTGARDGEAAGLARIQSVLDSSLAAFQPPVPR